MGNKFYIRNGIWKKNVNYYLINFENRTLNNICIKVLHILVDD